jgi:hypothetical protein
VNHLLVKAV